MTTDLPTVIRTVVVPLDGSLDSRAALRVGFGVAQRAGATVRLLRAVDGSTDDVDEAARSLAAAVERFASVAPAQTELVEADPTEAIVASGATDGVLVCMTSHGRGGISRLVMGSVAEAVVRDSPRPVLVVGPETRSFPLLHERATLTYCTDGTERCERGVEPVAGFATQLGLDVVVVESIGPDEEVSRDLSPPPRPDRATASTHCERLGDALRARGVPTRHRVLHGTPDRSIPAHVLEYQSSFLALATSSRTGLTRYTLGSTAAALVRTATVPVLLAGPSLPTA